MSNIHLKFTNYRFIQTALAALCLLLLTAATSMFSPPAQSQAPQTRPDSQAVQDNKGVVRKFFEAFNRHDVDAMAALADERIQWLTINGSAISIEADGRQALDKSMRSYFKSCPSCRSEIESLMVAGSFVSIHEKAIWESKTGTKSQKSLAVYEVRQGRVLKAWYYPAEK